MSRKATARRVVGWVGIVFIALAAAFGIDHLRQAMARDAVPWRDPAVTLAAQSGTAARPTLIRFTSDACPACYAMKAEVFSDDALAANVAARFVPVSVNLDTLGPTERQLAERHRIAFTPTLVIVDAAGREFARLEGFADLPSFNRWLDVGYDRWAAADAGPNSG